MGRSERVFNFNCPNNSGPMVQVAELMLPDVGDFELEAWISNFGSTNVHIFRGTLSLAEAQERVNSPAAGSVVDMLMTVTSAGPSRVCIPDDTGQITVFFEAANAAGMTEVVTVRIVGVTP